MNDTRIPTLVLGGTGYVAGEVIRLVLGHPKLQLAGVLSDSQPGEPVGKAFPHLAAVLGDTRFKSQAEIEQQISTLPQSAVFSAAPHGVSAALIDALLKCAEAKGTKPHVVDISADYRYSDAEAYAAVYKHPHGAPARLKDFSCALPEHLKAASTPHVAHPGCFATATLLASVPLLATGLAAGSRAAGGGNTSGNGPTLFISGITGSTGSGRKPVEGTHHPTRHSDLYSYNPLVHRHIPEIRACAKAASGVDADFAFVPHSGPFARGIHVTVQTALAAPTDTATALARLREFYADAPFVRVLDTAPRLKDIVATNYAHLSAATNGRTVAVMCVVDNLNKGAAGGAMQWMNRLFGLPETTGLTAPAAGWT
ncbi:MAG: N-acetyl-gamma-glutamyl-phosphate reductase [Sinobacteraceae bacterium]|nr:N-acetyl-gamma-glutamyl-phosphate reductase [Nevskiaceae bacterium]MCP5360207.1 N-acetyl-gamma-glutamyl-phosphate reductase [Nevskiaceae bacterium]